MTEKVRVDLRGAPATMLATLYARALDAGSPDSILRDTLARDVVDRIDYDWAATTITPRNAASVTVRAAQFDTWTRQFLAVNSEAVVLHLGCGLDSRYSRIVPGPGVDWFDVDYPEVVRIRQRVFPPSPGCHLIAASVTDRGWLAEIPKGRPTLMLAEGLTMYLTEHEGAALLCRIVDQFPSGELQFDAFNRLGVKTQWANGVVRRLGARLHWAINGPDDILTSVPGTRLLRWVPVFESEAFARVGGVYRLMAAAFNRVPGVRTIAQFHRYAY
ncbi:MAG: class I SAM-dependent methyltransferase [Mycolicibacterium sp.]|uniref:class I SAM-dependent methyltransferase n=1 Tax=Mycolicibacterium sp. TaxID=2320850 RepID=UPI003D0C5FF1